MGDFNLVDDPPTREKRAGLDYKPEPAGRVSVRGFRLLLALTLVNTTLLGASVMGPQLFPFLRGQWRQWRENRERRRAEELTRVAFLATRKQCLAYAPPAGAVVYDEDPAEASRILRDGVAGFSRAMAINEDAPRGWVPPVQAVIPKSFTDFQSWVFSRAPRGWTEPLLFLHERTAPGGKKYLVAVQLSLRFDFNRRSEPDERSGQLVLIYGVDKHRTLTAGAWPADGDDSQPFHAKAKSFEREYRLLLPDSASHQIARWPTSPGAEAVVPQVDYGNVLRVFAGQPDPNDPSRFTIPYKLAGRDGVIDGFLKDDGLHLRPREGEWTFDAGEVWKLPPGPVTRPTLYPTSPSDGAQ
jgi:hypothetical protein